MRADPKIVTPGPTCERVSNESTNSAMMRKMRHGSSLMKVILVLSFMSAQDKDPNPQPQASKVVRSISNWHARWFQTKLGPVNGLRGRLSLTLKSKTCWKTNRAHTVL